MQSRRGFIKAMGQGGLLLGVNQFPFQLFDRGEITKLTILHTNDVHSRVDPFPMDGSRNEGLGGVVRRAKLIESIRKEEENVILLDSGDIFQGTPYFNFFGGEIEMKCMSEMSYDVATMGNHDFDAGIEGFIKQLRHADFPFVMSNYRVEDTALSEHLRDFVILERGGIKIGVFGLGIELDGLIPVSLSKGVSYLDPIKEAQRVANRLKHDEKCDVVICLSHLGYSYKEEKVSDVVLARNTENIDLILGGHTHTFLKEMQTKKNKNGDAVFVNQAGFGGILLGRIDLYFENNNKAKCQTCKNLFVK